MCTFVCVCVCEPQEGNEVDKYNLNHPKLIHRPFMTLYIMVVGKFYDNFHDLPAQQNHFNLYKNDDEDDPVAWAPAATATSTKTMPKVCFSFFLFKIFVASLRFSYEFAGLSQFNFQNWFNVLHCTTKIIRLFPFSLFFCRLKTQTTADLTDESSFVLHESGKLLVKPYIEELPELFVSYFKEILRVGYQIPRLEYYMSNGENVCVYSRNW